MIVPIRTESCNHHRKIMKMTGRLDRGLSTTFRTATVMFMTNSRIIAVKESLPEI